MFKILIAASILALCVPQRSDVRLESLTYLVAIPEHAFELPQRLLQLLMGQERSD